MATRLKRRKRVRCGIREESRVSCRPHLQWVRGFPCLVNNADCWEKIDAHHVRTRGAGGGDEQVVPLCRFHHGQLDSPGWSQKKFQEHYKLDMATTAADLWERSPHGRKYRREHEERTG